MNRRQTLIASAAALLPAFASSSRTDALQAKAAVKAVLDAFYDRAGRRDWDAAGALFAPEFRILTDGAETFDKPTYVRLLKQDDIVVSKMELKDLEIHASAPSIGWCRYRGYFETVSGGKPSRTETAETMIFEKRDGAWLIVHAHASIKQLDA
jgi:ketosteroid isomerase-like protein